MRAGQYCTTCVQCVECVCVLCTVYVHNAGRPVLYDVYGVLCVCVCSVYSIRTQRGLASIVDMCTVC